jgi:hypothetical protein
MSRRRRESGKGRKAGKQERPRLTVSAGSGEEPVERKRPVRVSYRDDGQWQVMQGEELIAVEPSLERAGPVGVLRAADERAILVVYYSDGTIREIASYGTPLTLEASPRRRRRTIRERWAELMNPRR